MVYQATITSNKDKNYRRQYIGVTSTEFKKRLANHRQSFKKEVLKNSTALSKEYWNLKEKKMGPIVKWKIIDKAATSKSLEQNCWLCLKERYHIATYKYSRNLLNKRNEIAVRCPHRKKYVLLNMKK